MARRSDAQPYDRADATAWVTEEVETLRDDLPFNHFALGVFNAHIEVDCVTEELGEPVTLDEAVGWARARADRVIVRTCEVEREGKHYTAGLTRIDWGPDRISDYPASGLGLRERRLPGYEFVDRTAADPPIDWDVRVSWKKTLATLNYEQPQGLAALIASEFVELDTITLGNVHADSPLNVMKRRPRDAKGRMNGRAVPPPVQLSLRVSARTHAEASASAVAAADRAVQAALDSVGAPPLGVADVWQTSAVPSDSRQAGRSPTDA